MLRTGRLSLIIFLGLIVLIALLGSSTIRPRNRDRSEEIPVRSDSSVLNGQAVDDTGPVPFTRLRLKGTRHSVLSNAHGEFRLPLPRTARDIDRITAWKDGYFIAGADANGKPRLHLSPLPRQDFEEYAWVDPTPDRTHKQNCGNCHAETYREWSESGHAQSATNRHFLSMYLGTDWYGQPAGWSLRDEYPDAVGVCTACHAPTVADRDPAYFDLGLARGVDRQGVHCDYCHKIADAGIGTIGLTHGRFGLKLLRPATGQLFFGPLDDVDRGEDAYSSLYQESRYCASCHEGTVLGVHLYRTFSEWLDSPARKEGKQCQTCHMAPTGRMNNIAPGKGGIQRDPATLGNHRFFAGSQLDMLREAVKLTVTTTQREHDWRIALDVRADAVGHCVPTGFVDRHLILIVEATDAQERRVTARSGPVLPPLAGSEFAGLPGRLFARVLKDHAGRAPVPFWRAEESRTEDTRLMPDQTVSVIFSFPSEARRLHIRLLHRRGWEEVAQSKAWPDNQITISDQRIELGRSVLKAH